MGLCGREAHHPGQRILTIDILDDARRARNTIDLCGESSQLLCKSFASWAISVAHSFVASFFNSNGQLYVPIITKTLIVLLWGASRLRGDTRKNTLANIGYWDVRAITTPMVAAVMVALRWLVSPDIGLYDVGKDTEVNYKAEYERYIQLLDDPGNQRDTTELLTTLNRQVMDPKDLHHLKLPPQESPLPEGKTQKKRKSDDTEIDAENAPPAKRKQKYAYRHKDGATTSKKGVQKNQHWVKDSKRKGKNSKGKGKDNSMDVDQL